MKLKEVENHKIEVAKLKHIESDLIHLIANTNIKVLMDKYSEFSDQRVICNQLLSKHLDNILSK